MPTRARFSWLIAAAAFAASAAASTWLLVEFRGKNARAADPDQCIRVKYDQQNQPLALETAVLSFVPSTSTDDRGLQVDLVGAVHIADKGYYDDLNRRFEGYDAVLYEMVADDNVKIPKNAGEESHSLLSTLQIALKNLLDLEFQLSGIDYTKTNLVHADFTPEQFSRSMAARGENVWSMIMQMLRAAASQEGGFGKSSDADLIMALFDRHRALKLKRIFAEQFAALDGFSAAFSGPEGSTLVTERNKAALEVLKMEIAAGHKRIAIFYGAAHMPDMSQRLVADFHLKLASITWLEAWNLRSAAK
jgi:hypothetical protein